MTLPRVMRAVLLKGHGGFEQLECRDDVPLPRPKPGGVLIRVAAAGVNNTDINTRIGWYAKRATDGTTPPAGWTGAPLAFPRIQGADVCGRIVAVAADVEPARIGERVLIDPALPGPPGAKLDQARYFGSECDGGFAEYTTVAARHAHRIESGLSDVELAAVPCAYSAAENMLARADIRAGEAVLVTGASGGVGSAAVQLAKRRGATVLAVTGAAKGDEVTALGADRIIPRQADLLAACGPESVDAVIDVVGGPRWAELLEVLRRGGRYAVAGAIAGPTVTLDLRTLYLKDLWLLGCTVPEPDVFPSLIRYLERGELKPVVARKYPLEEIVRAQQAFLSKEFTGKIVLTI
jgi:NADPH:quinone reductase-like Zn-dependent oxidoreductase